MSKSTPEQLALRRVRWRERYRTDPVFAAKARDQARAWRSDPVRADMVREKNRTWMRTKYQSDPEYRAGVRKRWSELYRLDPDRRALVRSGKEKRRRALSGVDVQRVRHDLVADRDGWRCSICGGIVTRDTWSLDHLVPLSQGGGHTYANIVLAHRSCNSRRGSGRLPSQAVLFPEPERME